MLGVLRLSKRCNNSLNRADACVGVEASSAAEDECRELRNDLRRCLISSAPSLVSPLVVPLVRCGDIEGVLPVVAKLSDASDVASGIVIGSEV